MQQRKATEHLISMNLEEVMAQPMTTTATRQETKTCDAWADLNDRWFLAWRMANVCDAALREVHTALAHKQAPDRAQLERISRLLHRELQRWVRRGEALDMIVEHLPQRAV